MATMTQEETIDFMDMSDEEFETYEETGELPDHLQQDNVEEDTAEETNEDTVNPEEESEDVEDDTSASDTEEEESEDEPESQDDEEAEGDEEATDEDSTEGDTEEEETPKETQDELDYKKAYEELMKPFKANGTEIKVTNIEDQRRLMQMGANYELKMKGIKPVKVLQKTLEDVGIISDGEINEEELNFLLDLKNKKPEAINKLIADAGIDPLDLSVDKEDGTKYEPTNYIPDNTEVELNEVIKELEHSDGYAKTVKTITTDWDAKSRDFFASNPQAIRDLNKDVEQGVFDEINSVVQTRKVLGTLGNKSDIEAYIEVANELAQSKVETPVADTKVEAPATKAKKEVNTNKRKAATITKTKGAAKKQSDINPLTLSDEEFEKMFG